MLLEIHNANVGMGDNDTTTATAAESDTEDNAERAKPIRVNVRLPPALLRTIDDNLELHHSRSEWVRDAIRQRLRRTGETDSANAE